MKRKEEMEEEEKALCDLVNHEVGFRLNEHIQYF